METELDEVCEPNNGATPNGAMTDEFGIELYDHSADTEEYYNLSNAPEHVELRERLNNLLAKGFPVQE